MRFKKWRSEKIWLVAWGRSWKGEGDPKIQASSFNTNRPLEFNVHCVHESYPCHCLVAKWWAGLFGTTCTVACQGPLSMGFPHKECWSWLPCPSPGDLPDPGIEPRSFALASDFVLLSHQGSLLYIWMSPWE